MYLSLKRIVFVVLAVSFLYSGCFLGPGIQGEGEVITQTKQIGEIHGIVSNGFADVLLSTGNSGEVKIEGQQNIIDNLVFDINNDKICTVRNKKPVRNAKKLKIYVSLPMLKKAGINGSGNIISQDAFPGVDQLDLSINGSGNIDLQVTTDKLEAGINGSGDINLKGQARVIDVSISGSGDFQAYELKANDGNIRINGSGNCEVNTLNELEVGIFGSGDVYYKGTPQLKTNITGSGNVKPSK